MVTRKAMTPFRLEVPEKLASNYLGIPLRPKPKDRPRATLGRHGTQYVYKTRSDRMWERTIRSYVKSVTELPSMIGKRPLTMITIFERGVKDKYKWGEPMLARPDLSNYIKNIEDALESVIYQNDSVIYQLYSLKIYNDRDYINLLLLEGSEYKKILEQVLLGSATMMNILGGTR